ncbi:MAG: ergothioneine biosynthesis protein EgtB [Thermoleophilia bacterium]
MSVLEALRHAREATVGLLGDLPEEQMTRQVSPLLSPLVWDLAHIGHFEDLWLVRRVGGLPPVLRDMSDIYDAFANPRSARGALAVLPPADAWAYVARVRQVAEAVVTDLPADGDDPLVRDGFVVQMVARHELQHRETMVQALQLGAIASPPEGGAPPVCRAGGRVHVPAGTVRLGAADEAWAYDNERPAHEQFLNEFVIDCAPVTNGAYMEFMRDGGYTTPGCWTAAGWEWRCQEGAEAPLYWRSDAAGGWTRSAFGTEVPVHPDEPVVHVCAHEADAYARWAGARLPTEAEWERAARTPGVLEHAQGAVWQWTSSSFTAYPGFRAFPYREYSEVFFDDGYRVLRGGAWVTDPLVAQPTFRNWDHPHRRQIFAGFRCAADA